MQKDSCDKDMVDCKFNGAVVGFLYLNAKRPRPSSSTMHKLRESVLRGQMKQGDLSSYQLEDPARRCAVRRRNAPHRCASFTSLNIRQMTGSKVYTHKVVSPSRHITAASAIQALQTSVLHR